MQRREFLCRYSRRSVACSLLAGGVSLTASDLLSAAEAELFPEELVKFQAFADNPVFTAKGPGSWEVKIRERGWILREADGYHLWYTGYDGTRDGLKMLGYATSDDGLRWTRHPANPVYREHWVEDVMVVKDAGTYYMFAEGLGDQAYLLSSKDKVQWKKLRQLDVRKANGQPIPSGPYGTPTAWLEDGQWNLFYERRDAGVWRATSRDMKVWTNVSDDPVLSPGPAEADQRLIALNQIIRHTGRYYAYYHGRGDGPLWSSHIAVSDDLNRWTKYPGNPLLRDNKSSPIVVHDGNRYRLYSMHDQVHVHLPS